MEMNPLQSIVNITENKWYNLPDLAIICGFQLKLSGIDWRSNDELIKMMMLLNEIGFIEHQEGNPINVKISDKWYDFKQT